MSTPLLASSKAWSNTGCVQPSPVTPNGIVCPLKSVVKHIRAPWPNAATQAEFMLRSPTSAASTSVLKPRNPSVGGGPNFIGILDTIVLESDGQIVASDQTTVFRIDPTNGNRTILSGCVESSCTELPVASGTLIFPEAMAVVPPAGPPQVSALPSWGVPLLVGILIGLTVRVMRRPGLQAA